MRLTSMPRIDRLPAPDGGQDVASAADADDRDVAAVPHGVRQRRDVVADPLERGRVAVPLGDRRSGFAVDREPRDAAAETFGAAARSPHERRLFAGPLHEHVGVAVPARHVVQRVGEPELAVLRIDDLKRGRRRQDRVGDRGGAEDHGDDTSGTSATPAGEAAEAREPPPRQSRPPASTAELTFVRSSSGTTSAQPAAAPARSHAYSRPMGPPHRVSATVTAMPDSTNGTASDAVETAIDRISMTEPVAIGRNGTVRFTTCDTGSGAREPQRHARELGRRALRREPVRPAEHEHRPGRHPEHRQRDRKKRQVIPGQHRQQPRIERFQKQRGQGQQEQAAEQPGSSRRLLARQVSRACQPAEPADTVQFSVRPSNRRHGHAMRIYTFDTTLRDGTQGEAVSFSVDDKLVDCPEARRAGHRLHRGRLAGVEPEGQGVLRPRPRPDALARAADRVWRDAVRQAPRGRGPERGRARRGRHAGDLDLRQDVGPARPPRARHLRSTRTSCSSPRP